MSSTKMETSALSIPPVENPREWSTRKKTRVTLILGVMVLSFTYLSTAFALSATSLQRHFNTSAEVITLGLSLYVLGFALGPLLMGPLAQTNGKRPVYVVSWILFTACCFVISESNNLGAILAFRLLSSIAGSSALNNVPTSYSDMTTPTKYAPFFTCYGFSAFAGPSLGGLVGAFVNERAGWQWNLRHQAIFVAVVTVIGVLFVPETDHPRLKRLHDTKYMAKKNDDIESDKAKSPLVSRLSGSMRSFGSAVVRSIKLPFHWLLTGKCGKAIVRRRLRLKMLDVEDGTSRSGLLTRFHFAVCLVGDLPYCDAIVMHQTEWCWLSRSIHRSCTRSSTTFSSLSHLLSPRFEDSNRNR